MSMMRIRSFALFLVVLCLCGLVSAQTPNPEQEKQAEALFLQGEGRMKVASYEEAVTEFRNVLKRFPDTQVRYKAQFRLADALQALKKDADALALLQAVVKEESPEWSPQALAHIGELYSAQQKYSEAFRAYRQIITGYPSSPMVDRAHFAIGVTHFRLGHFELAAKELDQVGTASAIRLPELQRVSPGEPLYILLTEPNTVASLEMTMTVTVTAKSGDKESVVLIPELEGGERFIGSIPTELGTGKAGDGVLQLFGNDSVVLSYKSRYVGGGATEKTITMTAASNARLVIRDSQGNEVRGVVVSDMLTVEVNDPDRDVSGDKDTVAVDLKTKRKDTEKLTLTETEAHSGLYRATIKTAKGEPIPDSGSLETNADLAEGSMTQFDDSITVAYADELNLSLADNGSRKLSLTVATYAATPGNLMAVEHDITRSDLAIKALLYKGRSLTQIAATYRDLGQDVKALINFRQATEQFQTILAKYPNAPEVEDAMYGLYQNYLEQGQYWSAISMINQITRRFPQSTRASQALFELAALHVKREEFERALAIFQNLAQSAKGTPLAEEAQYAICTTYLTMLKPRPGSIQYIAPVSREQVAFSLEEFARAFPASERTPEAFWQLARLRYEGEDFRGTVDTARRMLALYPDHVMTGRTLLMQAQAQLKIRDRQGAEETLRMIIANYAGEADAAQALYNKLIKTAPATTTTKPATTTGGK
ncbi:MAG: tetratricopeptide repeat protein [Armatimonadota bacterium]